MAETEQKERKVYIDILRIIACMMVIFNHSNDRGFLRFLNDWESGLLVWERGFIYAALCKSAVPVFFMISGAMLLDKEESMLATFKRIPKILIDLILFSLFYFWIEDRRAGTVFSVHDTLKTMLQGSYWHLWYLYAYLIFIVTLPFFRRLVRGLDVKSSFYMFVMAAVTMGLIPIVEYFWIGIEWNLKPSWLIHNIFIYPLMGYASDRVLDIKSMKRIYLKVLWIVNIFCLVSGGICEYFLLSREPGSTSEIFLTNFCLVNAVTVFLTVKYLFAEICFGKFSYKIITEIGKCTFGIYLLHIWFLWKNQFFYSIWAKIERGAVAIGYIGIFISCILVFILAGVSTYILRKIPVVRRLL